MGDQVGRIACAVFMGMLSRMNGQREILERDITLIRIHAILLQRQRVGIAAGNGQVLTMELKTFRQFDVPQQINLGAIRCIVDRLGQRCIGFAIDRTHSLIAACAVRRAGRVRVEIGDGVVCIQVFHKRRCRGRRCFRTVCIRSVLHRVRLHRVRLRRAGSSICAGVHSHRGLFL